MVGGRSNVISKKDSEFNILKRCINKCGVTRSTDSTFLQISVNPEHITRITAKKICAAEFLKI